MELGSTAMCQPKHIFNTIIPVIQSEELPVIQSEEGRTQICHQQTCMNEKLASINIVRGTQLWQVLWTNSCEGGESKGKSCIAKHTGRKERDRSVVVGGPVLKKHPERPPYRCCG